MRMTVKPWFYKTDWNKGKYRLAKVYDFPPYPIEKSDTAYVEFESMSIGDTVKSKK